MEPVSKLRWWVSRVVLGAIFALGAWSFVSRKLDEHSARTHTYELRVVGTCAGIAEQGVTSRPLSAAAPWSFRSDAETVFVAGVFSGCPREQEMICYLRRDGAPWRSHRASPLLRRWAEYAGQHCSFTVNALEPAAPEAQPTATPSNP